MSFPFDFDPEKYEIVEGVEGVWHYHLSEVDSKNTLCGEPSMSTEIPISSWRSGNPTQIPMSYCEECEKEAEQNS